MDKDRLTEAFAMLEHLLADAPDDYYLRLWSGIVLLDSRQFEAARQALSGTADLNPARPEAWYWRGVVEIQAQRPDAAVPFLQNALVASARYAPAWETLGLLALNRGDLVSALETFSNAVAANPYRASTHFLIALAHAKASRPDEAAAALRIAVNLDTALLEEALRTDVFTRLFEPGEIEAMVEPAADTDTPSDAESGRPNARNRNNP